MNRRLAGCLVLALLLMVAMAGCLQARYAPPPSLRPDPQPMALVQGVAVEKVADGLQRPLLVTHDGARTFVVEQDGHVHELEDGAAVEPPFLDLSDQVATCHMEQGLLGLAFHPRHAENGRLYVAYTAAPCDRETDDRVGDLVVERWHAAPGAAQAEPRAELLRLAQPYRNHNGGHLAFGPDGMLYIGIGDGGGHNDPLGHGQDPHTLHGTILRLDVDGEGYGVPPDNPFADGRDGAPEVWAYGLRNPWRFAFDPASGDLWIADVGQDEVEEVHLAPAGQGGLNLGWSAFEGSRRFGAVANGPVTPPVYEYPHQAGQRYHCSVTGGVVARGTGVPALEGLYLFGDFCSGVVWGLEQTQEAWKARPLLDTGMAVSSFGTGPGGETYLVHHGGIVYRLVAA